jgi:uncharacterized membrane protein
MTYQHALPLAAVLVFLSCSTSKPGNAPSLPINQTTLRGHFSTTAKGMQLLACGNSATLCNVEDGTQGALLQRYQESCQPAPVLGEPAFAVLTGVLKNAKTFSVTRIDTLQYAGAYNSCVPYEFTCLGTEPFWSIKISPSEGVFYKNPSEETGQFFEWAAAAVAANGNSWNYALKSKQGSLNILIRKEKCADGMSDRQYSYTVDVAIGGKRLKGCAIRYGEPMPVDSER